MTVGFVSFADADQILSAIETSRDDVPFACPIGSCAIFIGSKDGSSQVRIVVAVRLHCFAGGVRLHASLLRLLRGCSTSLLRRLFLPVGSEVTTF
ncbi:hypothetical protein KFK09_028954 [Dendrobium nobile]|uniref:Uncharacterized protein n=1 Tax=Dendrobium nobile TaxID=94219 RepID=A0A8T3A970_DENNO|nr:hypothetical protein KFK09_028954 [Dendrobium nobile]